MYTDIIIDKFLTNKNNLNLALQDLNAIAILLGGSRCRGLATEESDYDLDIYLDEQTADKVIRNFSFYEEIGFNGITIDNIHVHWFYMCINPRHTLNWKYYDHGESLLVNVLNLQNSQQDFENNILIYKTNLYNYNNLKELALKHKLWAIKIFYNNFFKKYTEQLNLCNNTMQKNFFGCYNYARLYFIFNNIIISTQDKNNLLELKKADKAIRHSYLQRVPLPEELNSWFIDKINKLDNTFKKILLLNL